MVLTSNNTRELSEALRRRCLFLHIGYPSPEREKEILRWVAAGLQNKEIAHKLGISLATVRNHLHNILEKLDVHSKLEAVSLAFRQGWVSGPNGELGLSPEPATRQ